MELSKRVYAVARRIPMGRISTYREVAHAIGCRCYRLIGQILAKNPHKNVPCHRVVKSNGEVGGFCGSAENRKKIEILRKEGIIIKKGEIQDFENMLVNSQELKKH